MKATIACTFLFSLGTAVFANETAQENTPIHQLPELVVTASLWETDLLHTTHSTTAIDSSVLESSGSLHFQDLIEAIPNLTWTGGTSRPRYFQIRGIGENSQFEGETPDSTVRFLIDDLDFTGLGSIGNLFDMQQVEVLRGPQAGAFGVNAAGGLIKLVSNEPTPYWSGQVEGTIGQDNLRGGGIAFGGPILNNDPEAFTFRLSTYQLSSDGFRSNKTLNQDDTNERDEFNSRLKLKWKASSDWTWDSTLFYANTDNGYDEWSLNNTDFTIYSDEPGRDEQESKAASVRGNFIDLSGVQFSSTTTYIDTNTFYSYDGDWGDGPNATAPSDSFYDDALALWRDRTVYSQELRLDSETGKSNGFIDRWTVGFYTQGLKETGRARWTSGGYRWNTDFDSEAYALFGQIGKDITAERRLTLKIRGEYYKVAVQADGLGPDITDPNYPPTVVFDYALNDSEFLWGGTLTYEQDLSANTLSFVSLSRAYKAGGASTPNFTQNEQIKYDSEILWNAETGLRNRFWGGALSTSLTAFFLYRENAQFRDSKGVGTFFDYITVNGKSAKHYGIESDATWTMNSNWKLSASLGLLKATRESYANNEAREVANAPSYNYSLRLDYLGDNGFFANTTLSGSDSYYESNSHDEKRSTFNIVNAALGYRIDNWTLTFWGRNLLNTEYEKSIFYFDNTYDWNSARYENPADPQQFGATLNYTW
jgi:outer membrane receptor protein involved in Fe transport